jgi:hypothetical protein
MFTAKDLIIQIEDHLAEIRAALDPPSLDTFSTHYFALSDALVSNANPEEVAAQLLNLVRATPAVASILKLDEQPPQTTPTDPSTAQAIVEPNVQPIIQTTVQPTVQTQPDTPLQGEKDHPLETSADTAASKSARKTARRGTQTEDFLMIMKEVVTAVIALSLVWATVAMSLQSLYMVGDAVRVTQAKDILMVMIGLLGVVLGYYFGRIPADARAAQAQDHANEAVAKGEQAAAHSDQVSLQADQLANWADQMASRLLTAPAQTRGDSPTPQIDIRAELQNMQKEVQNLRQLARNH